VLNHKTIICKAFGWYIYYPFSVVATEVSDVCADVGVHHRAVKTPLTKIHVWLAKWNVPTMLRSISMVVQVLIPLHASWSSEKAAPRFTFSKKGPYHSYRISLILIHTFAKCLITLSISTSLKSRKAYRICIQLIPAIGLNPHKTLLRQLPALWLSLSVQFLPDMNRAFSLDTNPAMSSRRSRTRARTNEWDMTAEHALSRHCDELQHSVDKSGHLDNTKHIVF